MNMKGLDSFEDSISAVRRFRHYDIERKAVKGGSIKKTPQIFPILNLKLWWYCEKWWKTSDLQKTFSPARGPGRGAYRLEKSEASAIKYTQQIFASRRILAMIDVGLICF